MISTTAACGYLPAAPCVGGPLDGTRVAPLRRKRETVHPDYRTREGRSVRGDGPPVGQHYVHRGEEQADGLFDVGFYEWVEVPS
jgi:hypothetical protein